MLFGLLGDGGEAEKQEALRQKYFEDKRVEFEQSCDAGDAGACFSLGEWWLLFGKDADKAHKLFDSACEMGNGNACFSLGQLYQGGRLGETEEERKVKTFELSRRACELKSVQACSVLGMCYLHAFGCRKDVAEAQRVLRFACSENDANACMNLGRLFLDGEDKHGVKRDPARAHELMKSGCELGHPNCCQVLSVMYHKGDGVEADPRKHEYYKERTMDLVRQAGAKMGATVVE